MFRQRVNNCRFAAKFVSGFYRRWNYLIVLHILSLLTSSLSLNSEKITRINVNNNSTTAISFESEPLSSKCPPGYEAIVEFEKVVCVKCIAGYFRNASMTKCSLCPAGEETSIEGMKECIPCYYGKFKLEGEMKCHDCPKGTISLLKGAKECLKCPSNFYCPCSVCHPVICSSRGFCPEGTESPLLCKLPLMKRIGPDTGDCALTSELIGLICGAVLLLTLLSSVILANIFLKPRTDVVFVSGTDTGSTRYLLQDASSTELRYSGL